LPHCIIEYSKNLESRAAVLMRGVYDASVKSGFFSEKGIKVRAIPYDHALVGGVESVFVHVTARIFAGRSTEQKAQLSELIMSEIQQVGVESCSLTVEVVDIDNQSYAKFGE